MFTFFYRGCICKELHNSDKWDHINLGNPFFIFFLFVDGEYFSLPLYKKVDGIAQCNASKMVAKVGKGEEFHSVTGKSLYIEMKIVFWNFEI